MKNLVILGSTGSIGTQTLDVIDFLGDTYQIQALSANNNIDLLEKQVRKYQPEYAVVASKNAASIFKNRIKDLSTQVLEGSEGLEHIAGIRTDLVINALVGAAGLAPTVAALKNGNKLALANKESLVIGGEIINRLLEDKQDFILPIDSEHNAIFQLLKGHDNREVKNLILTASGGPFLNKSIAEMESASVEDALRHPNWDMGGKITIDSATLMNKGLEVIEAHWLFKQPFHRIKVVIHPESIIHSLVEFIDNSITAELGAADMRIPIQNVLLYPDRKKSKGASLNLIETGRLNFQKPDLEKFPALKLAYTAGKSGGSLPVVLNAANEIAVYGFLNNKVAFTDITEIIARVMDLHKPIKINNLEDIFAIDKQTRKQAREVMNNVVNNH